MGEIISNYADFWPFYLREHARPETRALHYIGTGLGLCILITGLFAHAWLLLAAPIVSYGFAWGAHLAVERNRSACS